MRLRDRNRHGLIQWALHATTLATLLLLLVPMGTALAATASTLPRELEGVSLTQKLDQQVPLDIGFRDESGVPVTLGNYFNGKRPVVISLVYFECPMLCTYELNGLLKAMRVVTLEPGNDYEVLTVSFDPHEGPELAAEKKRHYAAAFGRPSAAQGWHFLTGTNEQIHRLAHAVGFDYQYLAEKRQYAHPSALIILTPQGKVSRYLNGIEYSGRDLRFSLVDASAEKIGSPVDQAVLYCFHYDPSTGKYTLMVVHCLQAAAVLTLLVMGGFFFVMWRHQPRGKVAF